MLLQIVRNYTTKMIDYIVFSIRRHIKLTKLCLLLTRAC